MRENSWFEEKMQDPEFRMHYEHEELLEFAKRLAEALVMAAEEPYDFWLHVGMPLIAEAREKKLLRTIEIPSASMKLPVKYNSLDWRRGDTKKVREDYCRLQNGKCFWCNEPLDQDPPPRITKLEIEWSLFPGGEQGFLRSPVHLQHDHKTGMTEGAVHALCNAVMWQYHGR